MQGAGWTINETLSVHELVAAFHAKSTLHTDTRAWPLQQNRPFATTAPLAAAVYCKACFLDTLERMSKTKEPYKKDRLAIERAWEAWPGRKNPASTQNMHEFFRQHSKLMDYRDAQSNDVWQEVKVWLIAYERGVGRRRSSS